MHARISPPEEDLQRSSHLYAPTPPPAQQLRPGVGELDDIDVELDPMDCRVYLTSPIQTLANSIQDVHSEHISLHDIADAYSTLSTRIQDNAHTISRVDRALAALELIKAQASIVTVALRRDVGRVFVDPAAPNSPSPVSSVFSENSMFPQFEPECDLSEDQIKVARDQHHVCHHALQLLSDVFRFPVLQNLFSVDQLGNLLDDILSIAFCVTLPMFNSKKSSLFCLWMLQTQQLPVLVLSSRSGKLVAGLKDMIEAKPIELVLESVKIICHLIKQQPAVYVPEFAACLPALLNLLISPSYPILRHEIARLLAAIVHCLRTGLIEYRIRNLISQSVLAFVDANTTKSKHWDQSSASPRLSHFVHDALDKPDEENKPQWAATVVASIIVLSDAQIFLHKRCLKFVLPVLSKISVYKNRSVRAFHVPLWKCIVWALARLREASMGIGENGSALWNGVDIVMVYDSAFHLSKEELTADICVAITGVVLGRAKAREGDTVDSTRTVEDVVRALSVIRELVGHKDKEEHWKIGMNLLARLTSRVGAAASSLDNEETGQDWDYNDLLARELFDGSLLNAGRSRVRTLASEIRPTEVGLVRQLSESEIMKCWDALLQIWIDCISGPLAIQGKRPPIKLTQVWQALLLCQTQLTQELGHLTTPPEFVHRASSLLTDFLRPDHPAGSTITGKLTLASGLWTVMKNVFATAWLSNTAEFILGHLMTNEFDFENDNLRAAWCALYEDLVLVGVPSVVNILLVNDGIGSARGVKRLAWEVVANNWRSYEDKLGWQVAADFLLIPLGLWRMSAYEDELWDAIFLSTIRMAAITSIRPVDVVQNIVERIRAKNLCVSDLNGHINILLSHVDLTFLPISVFSMVDGWLQYIYPPAGEEQLNMVCGIVQTLKRIVCSLSPPFVIPFLVSLSGGLCIWIKDELGSLADSEYNDVMMSFYEEALESLKKHPPDVNALHELAPFLVSAFARIPPPALGPIAFKRFWDMTYQGVIVEPGGYPTTILNCLKAYHDVYGGEPGLFLESLGSRDDSSIRSAILSAEETRSLREPTTAAGSKISQASDGPALTPAEAARSDRLPVFSEMLAPPSSKRRKVSNDSEATGSRPGRDESLVQVGMEQSRRGDSHYHPVDPERDGCTSCSSYDEWETGLESLDARRLCRKLLLESCSISSDDEDYAGGGGSDAPETGMSDLLPSLDVMVVDRVSASENELIRTSQSLPEENPQVKLDVGRGAYDDALEPDTTTATPSVDVLQRAFEAMRTNGSQLSVADLMQASSMVQDLQGLLQDKLKRKFAKSIHK